MDTGMTETSRRRALAVVSAGYFFVLLDVTIVNVALADIGRGLGASRAELQWVVDAYALVLASFMLSAGDLVDRLGSRRLFLVGLGLFGVASVACAAAPSGGALIAARVAQGLGAAAILPTSLAIVNQLFPDDEERPRAIGVWAALGGSAMVLGPVLGGLLVDGLGWRAVFWLNVPLVVASLALAVTFVPAGPTARHRQPDLPGQLLGTVALVAAIFALIEGGREGPTTAALSAGGLSILALAGFVGLEWRRQAPMLDPRWFRRLEFSGANTGSGLMNLGTLGALFAISLYLQQQQGLTPLRTGLNLLPLALLTPFTGRLVAVAGTRRPAGYGLLACGLAYAALALFSSKLTTAPDWVLLAVAGAGMAVAVPGLVAGATEALGPDRAGIAAAVNNTSRQVGGAIGVALIGGFASVSASLAASAAALVLGGAAALTLMRPRPIPR
jgi:MFS transporter, DHA2 family, methylenomycin A resistance protein